jgi:Cdc6-like AAA superfamily ATPase
LDWIAPRIQEAQYTDNIRKREPGTGQWFLESPLFAEWLQGKKQNLFCPGIPGAGKTVLASIVIEHLRSSPNGKLHTLFLYCSDGRGEYQKIEGLLRSLLRQFAEQCPAVPKPVEDLYGSHNKADNMTQPSCEEIFKALSKAMGAQLRVFIIVDALDECLIEVRRELLTKIRELQEGTTASFLATSRPSYDDIEQYFKKDARLEIRADDDDVAKYVSSHFGDLSKSVQTPELQEKIKQCIAKNVGGMYVSILWNHIKSRLPKPRLGSFLHD